MRVAGLNPAAARNVLRCVAAAAIGAGLAMIAVVASAQPAPPGKPVPAVALLGQWPSARIRLLVAADEGSRQSVLARILAHRLVEALGQQVTVEARPGEGGLIAAKLTAGAAPDGLTWLAWNEAYAWLAAQATPLPLDPVKGLLPVTQIARSHAPVLVAHPGMPARTLGELAVLAKASPTPLHYPYGSNDPMMNLANGLLRASIGGSLAPQPLGAGELALGAVIAGRALVGFVDAEDAVAAVRSGRARALAIAGQSRHPALTTVPTMIESKIEGFEVGGWQGLWMTAGTPLPIAQALQAEVASALKRLGMEERLAELGLAPVASVQAAFAAFVATESERLRVLARRVAAAGR